MGCFVVESHVQSLLVIVGQIVTHGMVESRDIIMPVENCCFELVLDGAVKPFHMSIVIRCSHPDVPVVNAPDSQTSGEVAAKLTPMVRLDGGEGEGCALSCPLGAAHGGNSGEPDDCPRIGPTGITIQEGDEVAADRMPSPQVDAVDFYEITRARSWGSFSRTVQLFPGTASGNEALTDQGPVDGREAHHDSLTGKLGLDHSGTPAPLLPQRHNPLHDGMVKRSRTGVWTTASGGNDRHGLMHGRFGEPLSNGGAVEAEMTSHGTDWPTTLTDQTDSQGSYFW